MTGRQGGGTAPHAWQALAGQVTWYQSVVLPDGVRTAGAFDTIDQLRRIPFPESLEGQRCLDIATADGFWAFEMERRGATDVLAIDIPNSRLDWPAAVDPTADRARVEGVPRLRGFDIAHEALESSVRWQELSVYDLSPQLVGEFDFVFIGSVLCHLRDPVAALTAIATVLRGRMLSVDAISAPLTLLHPRAAVAGLEIPGWPLWWVPNLRAYRALFGAAGLEIRERGRPFFLKRGPAYDDAFLTDPSAERSSLPSRMKQASSARLGNMHAWVSVERQPRRADAPLSQQDGSGYSAQP